MSEQTKLYTAEEIAAGKKHIHALVFSMFTGLFIGLGLFFLVWGVLTAFRVNVNPIILICPIMFAFAGFTKYFSSIRPL